MELGFGIKMALFSFTVPFHDRIVFFGSVNNVKRVYVINRESLEL